MKKGPLPVIEFRNRSEQTRTDKDALKVGALALLESFTFHGPEETATI